MEDPGNMAERNIYLTEFDKKRLSRLIEDPKRFKGRDRDQILILQNELERGEIVDSKDMPDNVITMNSKVMIQDLDTREEMVYTLVFPAFSKVEEGKLSIVSPLGIALIGFSVGDTIEWNLPGGVRKLYVKEILYQPESAGDYNL